MPGLMTAKELRAKRATIANEAQEIVKLASDEGREFTSEERTKFDAIMADVDALKGDIDRIEKHEALTRDLAAPQRTIVGGREVETPEVTKDERAAQHAAAFRAYLMGGEQDLSPEHRSILREMRAQAVGTDAAGGYTVPEGFSNQLEESMLAFGGMREAANVFSTASGNDLPWPTVNDTAQKGAILAENTAASEQDFTFASVIFGAYKYSSKLVKVSVELLQDSAFDLNAFLARNLGTRIARITNEHFTTGTGTAQPNGVVTAASLGKAGTTGQTTTVIYDDLVDLQHSVDPAYRRGAIWMLADSSVKVIKKLKDADNRPLWSAGLAVREPDTILGVRYVINQDVPAMAASAKSILFGDFSKYMIRDVLGVQVLRLNERYADAHQVGFLAFSRHDGDLLDAGTDPIKYYQNSAT